MLEAQKPLPRKLKIGNTTIEYIVNQDAGKDVLFLHGLNGDFHTWDKVIPKISPKFRCWAISLPKYGKSKIDGYSKLVEDFTNKLKIKPFFVGYSLGGLIFQNLASKGIEAEKTIFISIPAFSKPPVITKLLINLWGSSVKRSLLAKSISTLLFSLNYDFRQALKEAPVENWLDCYVDLINQRLPFDISTLKMKNEFGIVYARKDGILKICNGTELYRKLKPSLLTEIESSSHFIPTTCYKELAEIVNDFFS